MTVRDNQLALALERRQEGGRSFVNRAMQREFPYLLFVLPAAIIYTILTIIPLITTFGYSFTDFDGLSPDVSFVGLSNYLKVFSTKFATGSFTNSIVYGVTVPILITVLAIPLALVFDSQMKTRNIQRAVFFFPSVISALFLGFIWNFILSPSNQGLVNSTLLELGQRKLLLLADPTQAMVLLIVVTVWASTGWHACVYLANLQLIDKSFYEAADIDGASAFQQFKYITLPNLAPAMTISVMFLLLGSLKAFDLPLALTKGGPGYATTMITQAIITEGINSNLVGFASAMSMLFLVLIGAVTLFQLKVMGDREERLS